MTDPPAPSVRIGEVLAGKYEVVDHIGQGGMGYVFEGLHRGLGQRVAIKVLRKQRGHDEEMIARFEREARAAAKLKSEHTARVMDVDVLEDGTPFMVMELLEGHDLETELCRFGKLPIAHAVDLVLQACSAMAEAHQRGIVHRDLKPPNLFLCPRGDGVTVKLLDFGISKMETEGQKSVTQTSSSLGTPLYMSPEQIRSAKHVDERTDIWSLGVILYELIAGTTPFEADSPTAVIAAITADAPVPLVQTASDVPEALSMIVMKALEKHPDRRWRSVDAFAKALAPHGSAGSYVPAPRASAPSMDRAPRSLSDAPTLPQAASGPERETHNSWETARLAGPRGRTLALGALVVGAIGAVVVAMVMLSSGDPPETPGPSVAAEPAPEVTPEPEPPERPAEQSDPGAESSSEPSSEPSAEPTATASAPRVARPPRVPAPPPVAGPPPPPPPPPVAPEPKSSKNPLHL